MKASIQRNIGYAGQVFTVTDAAMTAGFGWIVSSIFIMKPVYAGALGALSYVLAFLPVVAFALYQRGYKPLAVFVMLIYVGGFGANFYSNYGLSASVFKGNIIAAQNANTTHSDVRERVKRLRKRVSDLTKAINFEGGVVLSDTKQKVYFNSPNAYDELIAAYSVKRENEDKKRGGCGIKCEGFIADVANLKGAKANAEKRLAFIQERSQTRKELKTAEAIAKETPKTFSVAAGQSEYLARLWEGKLDPDKKVMDWALIYVAVGISLSVSVFAHLCNLICAMNLAGVREPEQAPPPQEARNPYLPDTRVHDGRPAAPQTTPQAGRDVYVLQSETIKQDDAGDALERALERVKARFNPEGARA